MESAQHGTTTRLGRQPASRNAPPPLHQRTIRGMDVETRETGLRFLCILQAIGYVLYQLEDDICRCHTKIPANVSRYVSGRSRRLGPASPQNITVEHKDLMRPGPVLSNAHDVGKGARVVPNTPRLVSEVRPKRSGGSHSLLPPCRQVSNAKPVRSRVIPATRCLGKGHAKRQTATSHCSADRPPALHKHKTGARCILRSKLQ